MKINKSKLKIKYLYDLYKLSPLYPTEEDILFECIQGLLENGKLNEFNSVDIRRLHIKLPEHYNSTEEIMNVFIEQGFFEEVTRYKKTNTVLIEYKFIKHPWI